MRDDLGASAEGGEQALEGTGAGLDRRDAPRRAELGERNARQRLGRVGEDAERTPAPASDRSAALVAASRPEVDGRAVLGEALEQGAPVPGARRRRALGRGRRSSGSVPGSTSSTARADSSQALPERAGVAERAVEVDGERATLRHARRRARTDCQSDDPGGDAERVDRDVERRSRAGRGRTTGAARR